ncbi:hypothetical protein MG293_010263 [Ovis ammon polii]|uniref:Uncharacterized protein n=1 Tax=Ovis ammon polii TaxID=230172 RepID=A0AAD4U3R2_OVIAM|nr:hypothetical protein MG293_010263 [Ovis ammon polii]
MHGKMTLESQWDQVYFSIQLEVVELGSGTQVIDYGGYQIEQNAASTGLYFGRPWSDLTYQEAKYSWDKGPHKTLTPDVHCDLKLLEKPSIVCGTNVEEDHKDDELQLFVVFYQSNCIA